MPVIAARRAGVRKRAGAAAATGGNNVSYVASNNPIGNNAGAMAAQQFTVGAACRVSGLSILISTGSGVGIFGLAAGATMSILSDDRLTTYATAVTTASAAAGAWASVTFATPVTLQPGVTYRVAISNGNSENAQGTTSPINAPSGSVATVGNVYYGGTGTTFTSFGLAFRLS